MARCKICQNMTKEVVSFGKMPISNSFLEKIPENEFFYQLALSFCPECFMVQLDETVPPQRMFNEYYQFISSTSSFMAQHFQELADEIVRTISQTENPFIIELGCNDGIMLKHLASKGIRHLGVEPSGNVADLARQNGVHVLKGFFNETMAGQIVEEYGQANIICGANVFCHIEDINSVFKGIRILLKEDGVLFFEDPYLSDIIEKTTFDQIYDEHIYYFSGLAISKLAKRYQMQLVDVVYQNVHGGSMRYYIKKGDSNPVSSAVKRCLSREKEQNLDKFAGFESFKKSVDKICLDLNKTLADLKDKSNSIVGYGATSKSATLLNYAKIGTEILDYICDTTPNKINKFTPGTHIPIKAYDEFLKDHPPYALLLAWNHKKEIFEKEKDYRARGGKFVTYFPEVIIE